MAAHSIPSEQLLNPLLFLGCSASVFILSISLNIHSISLVRYFNAFMQSMSFYLRSSFFFISFTFTFSLSASFSLHLSISLASFSPGNQNDITGFHSFFPILYTLRPYIPIGCCMHHIQISTQNFCKSLFQSLYAIVSTVLSNLNIFG